MLFAILFLLLSQEDTFSFLPCNMHRILHPLKAYLYFNSPRMHLHGNGSWQRSPSNHGAPQGGPTGSKSGNWTMLSARILLASCFQDPFHHPPASTWPRSHSVKSTQFSHSPGLLRIVSLFPGPSGLLLPYLYQIPSSMYPRMPMQKSPRQSQTVIISN